MPDLTGPDALLVLDRLADEVARVAGEADPGTPVPACPGWTLTDLVDHLGCVHLWAEHCARTGAQPDPYPTRDQGVPLAQWYAACARTLVDGLGRLPADHPSWSFSREPGHQVAGFWRRRQVHETSIHLVDALQASGEVPTAGPVTLVPGLSAAVAADGVAEALQVFAPRMLVRRRDEPPLDVVPAPLPVAFRCTDTGDTWSIQLVDGRAVTRAGSQGAVASISGPAVHLHLALWHRADPGLLEVCGDEAAASRLLAASLVP